MKKDCNETPENVVSLGQALKDARLAASLSIDEVAEQLHLSLTTVRDIESDLTQLQETKQYPVIYLRGYLGNYAKLVGLEGLELFAEYQQLSSAQQEEKTLPVSNLLIRHPKKRSKLLPLSLLFLMVACFVFYLAQKPVLSVSEQTPSSSDVVQVNETTPTLDIKKQTVETLVIDINNTVEASATTATEASVQAVNLATSTELAEPLIVATESKKKPSISESVIQVEVEKVQTAPQSSANIETLSLNFSAECWTEVFDATGKRIAYGLYKQGRALTLSGVPPFKLKLGDPSVVEIQYKDQSIEGGFTPGRTARFTVPLS